MVLWGKKGDEVIPRHPKLDTHERQVLNQFYKKPMAAVITMLARSSLPISSKVETAASDFMRRRKRTIAYLGRSKFMEILKSYMDNHAEIEKSL